MNPALTTVVYAILIIVALSIVTYMILYTRGLHTKRDTLEQLGRLPVSREEGISISTLKKEHAHRTGSIS